MSIACTIGICAWRRRKSGSNVYKMDTSLVLLCLLLGRFTQVRLYTLRQCNQEANFVIAENEPASITCEGLIRAYNIYWSIRDPSSSLTETRIGDCTRCTWLRCPSCSVNVSGFSMSRTATTSTLRFGSSSVVTDGSIVRCSRWNNYQPAFCRVQYVTAYSLRSCVDGHIQMADDEKKNIRCEGLKSSHTIYWTITYTDQTIQKIAECQPCRPDGDCPPCVVMDKDFDVARSGEASDLQIRANVREKNRATLRCSEKGNTTHDDCQLSIDYYVLPQCTAGRLDISETDLFTHIRCEGLHYDHGINWTLTDDRGETSQIAVCTTCSPSCRNTCTGSSLFTATRSTTSGDLIPLYNVRAAKNKLLTCIRTDNGTRDGCPVRVVYPAEVQDASVTVNRNWTVSASVTIVKVYASDSNITCVWRRERDNRVVDSQRTSPSLEMFLEKTAGPAYYKGSCSLSAPLSTSDLPYRLSVEVLPGNRSLFVGNVSVERPGELVLHSSCPSYVPEGNVLRCRCRLPSTKKGTPPAYVSWLHKTDSAVLQLDAVQRSQNGTCYICRSVWGDGEEVNSFLNYTLLVAYGPTTAVVTDVFTVSHGDTETVTLTCSVDDAYPSVNFTWNTACENVTSTSSPPFNSTCTVSSTAHGPSTPEVQCTAVNALFPVLRVAASFLEQREQETDGGLPVTAVASIAGVVVILQVIIVGVVVIVKRSAKPHSSSKNKNISDDDEFEEHINELYESTADMDMPSDNDNPNFSGPSYVNNISSTSCNLQLTVERTAVSQGDIYAEVDMTAKKQKKKDPAAAAAAAAAEGPQGDVYALVDKAANKQTKNVSEIQLTSDVTDTQAQDQKRSKGKKRRVGDKIHSGRQMSGEMFAPATEDAEYANCGSASKGENSVDVYMNVPRQSSPLEVTMPTEGDDEYNSLQFGRPDTQDGDAVYNHLGN